MTAVDVTMSTADRVALARAVEALEHPSLAARLANVIGLPLEEGTKLLPRRWRERVQRAAEVSIGKALAVAIASFGKNPPAGAHDSLHQLLAGVSGAAGGLFGLPALLVELPLTTMLILRGIADVAHSQGEDLNAAETRLACVEVFAVGGRTPEDNYAEIGYYEVRTALALHCAPTTLSSIGFGPAEALPSTVQVVRAIAQRFGVVVSDKAAAQLVPVLGAAAGAVVNILFMRHFQEVAEGHFIIRRLERTYGRTRVERAYRALCRRTEAAAARAAAGASGG